MVNGVRALFLPATVQTQQGLVSLSVAAYQGSDGNAFHFVIVSPPGSAPADAVHALYRSFRLLAPAEAASLRPRRIRTIQVGPADTLASLASRMAGEQKMRHFLMLNGRSEQSPLRNGELVKIVGAGD